MFKTLRTASLMGDDAALRVLLDNEDGERGGNSEAEQLHRAGEEWRARSAAVRLRDFRDKLRRSAESSREEGDRSSRREWELRMHRCGLGVHVCGACIAVVSTGIDRGVLLVDCWVRHLDENTAE